MECRVCPSDRRVCFERAVILGFTPRDDETRHLQRYAGTDILQGLVFLEPRAGSWHGGDEGA